jgi:hypothetical protein
MQLPLKDGNIWNNKDFIVLFNEKDLMDVRRNSGDDFTKLQRR